MDVVPSKQCKICAAEDADNIPLTGEYSGKQLTKLLARICQKELDDAKINDLIICRPCAKALVQTENLIDKLCAVFREVQKDEPVSHDKVSLENGTKRKLENNDDNGKPRKKPRIVLNCIICGKGFKRRQALRKHINVCCKGEKLKECPQCAMQFYSRQKHDTHVCKTLGNIKKEPVETPQLPETIEKQDSDVDKTLTSLLTET